MSPATDIEKETKKAKNVSKTKIKKKYSNAFLLKLLEDMIYVRRVEEKAGQQYGLRKIGGFCHLYIGQEAIDAMLKDTDLFDASAMKQLLSTSEPAKNRWILLNLSFWWNQYQPST